MSTGGQPLLLEGTAGALLLEQLAATTDPLAKQIRDGIAAGKALVLQGDYVGAIPYYETAFGDLLSAPNSNDELTSIQYDHRSITEFMDRLQQKANHQRARQDGRYIRQTVMRFCKPRTTRRGWTGG